MRPSIATFLCAAALIPLPRSAAAQAAETEPLTPVLVVVRTALGSIEIEVDRAHAPATAANFLRYVDGGFYDGGRFHRAVKLDNQPGAAVRIEVIQAGIDPARAKEGFPPIALERTSATGLAHEDGVVSMARAEPDTATSDFFVCIGDKPSLDFGGARNPDGQGFAAFGRVVAGMDVVRRIQGAPAEGQKLTPPVAILGVARKR
jgi:peptidyl-prolyl cis-trans isomerase A (cyclophilin A)